MKRLFGAAHAATWTERLLFLSTVVQSDPRLDQCWAETGQGCCEDEVEVRTDRARREGGGRASAALSVDTTLFHLILKI